MTDQTSFKLPDPVIPNSEAEAVLEDRAFHGAGHQDLPEWAQKLIGDLWHEVVSREKWYFEINPSEATPVCVAKGQVIQASNNED
jgi:hypothetical protein|tara:strand:- start:249 stop:503 length:255 start_codon:yes stop_codon:yes gene_type:complete